MIQASAIQQTHIGVAMLSNFQSEVQHEIQRLEARVQRLRDFISDMDEDMPESPDIEPRQQEDMAVNEQEEVPSSNSKPPRTSRPTEEQLVELLATAATNKNGSIDMRTDAGRTLRIMGLLDEVGFPTEEAESLMKVHKRSFRRRISRTRPAAAKR